MPTYAYKVADGERGCAYCRDGFEVQRKISERNLRRCPRCGAPVVRLITPVGINTKFCPKSFLNERKLKEYGLLDKVNKMREARERLGQ